jgi:hypothetical protein
MPYQINSQHLDIASGFHVIHLKNEHGVEHIVQIAVGHDACPACGAVHPKDNLDALDPKAMIAQVNDSINASTAAMMAYAAKHGLTVK